MEIDDGVSVFFAADSLFDKLHDVRTNPLTVGWTPSFRVEVRATSP